jgi:hypothetical protein
MKFRIWLAALALAAGGETTGQQPPVRLRSFGVPSAGTPGLVPTQSQLSVLAGQLSLQVQSVRGELGSFPLNPSQRAALVQAADRASQAADEYHRLTLQTGDLNRLRTAHRTLDAALDQFAATAARVAPNNPTISQAIHRVRFADERVHAALVGENPGEDVRRDAVVRLVRRLAEQADDLRIAVPAAADPRIGRDLPLSLRSFASQCARLSQALEKGAPVELARREVAGLSTLWASVSQNLAPLSATNSSVRFRAIRVNTLVQELVRILHPDPDWLPPEPDYGLVPRRGTMLVVGAGERGGPHVRVFHDPRGGASSDFFAYDPNYKGGVRVAVADLDGDGFPDIVTVPGRDHVPLVRVFSGRDLGLLAEFVAYDPPFTLGVHVAAADLTQDGRAIVAVAPGEGGPAHIKIFDLAAGKQIDDFHAHPRELHCGAHLALGDVTGDGLPDLVTAPAGGTGPLVQVWDGRNRQKLAAFNAFDEHWTGGVFVSVARSTIGRRAQVWVGSGAGQPGLVRAFDPVRGTRLGELVPFGPQSRGGVRVATFDATGDGVPDVLCAPGPGPDRAVRVIDGRTRRSIADFEPFVNFEGGSFVAAR